MDMKFTPGPWFTHKEGFSTIYVEALIGGGMVQETAACGPCEGGMVEQEANALLIAAAPDLLAALIVLTEEAPSSVEFSDWPELQAAVDAANEAIAKATGEPA